MPDSKHLCPRPRTTGAAFVSLKPSWWGVDGTFGVPLSDFSEKWGRFDAGTQSFVASLVNNSEMSQRCLLLLA